MGVVRWAWTATGAAERRAVVPMLTRARRGCAWAAPVERWNRAFSAAMRKLELDSWRGK